MRKMIFITCLASQIIRPMGFTQELHKSVETKNNVVNALHNALTAFDIDPKSRTFEIDVTHTTSDNDDYSKWSTTSSSALINASLASNQHLLEFVSYCAAAEIKYATETKKMWGCMITLLGLPAASGALSGGLARLLTSPFLPAEYQTLLEGATAVAGVGIGFHSIPKVSGIICNYLAEQSFSLGCKKLIEQEKIGAISAYLAYLKSKDHRPMSYEQKYNIVQDTLVKAGYGLKTEGKTHCSATVISPDSRKAISTIVWFKNRLNDEKVLKESFTLTTRIE